MRGVILAFAGITLAFPAASRKVRAGLERVGLKARPIDGRGDYAVLHHRVHDARRGRGNA